MPDITIYKHPIPFPSLSGEKFQKLQERIHARYQIITGGEFPQSRWSKIIRRKPRVLSFEGWFNELNGLVQDYEMIIQTLQEHKASYEKFFLILADDVKLTVNEKCKKFLLIEQKRLVLENEAITEKDEALLETIENQKQQLLRSVRLLGQATLLLLKKIDLFKTSLTRLADDQELQKQVLGNMVKRLDLYFKAYQLQKEINILEQEVAEMANVAVNFEEFMRDYLGPFQDLIEQVTEVDSELSRAVEEIKQITGMIVNEETGMFTVTGSEEFNEQMLEFLIQSHLKRERLVEVLEQTQFETVPSKFFELEIAEDHSEPDSVVNALNNIQTFVEVRLPQQSQTTPSASFSVGQEFEFNIITVDHRGQEINHGRGKASQQIEYLNSDVVLEMVYIPGGAFMMGSPNTEKDSEEKEHPQHQVIIAPFCISKFPVTQQQWKAIMSSNPSKFEGERRPVEQISWHDAMEFCQRLSEKTGHHYRLPYEAEWEYACRAGTTTPFHFGELMTANVANYNGNYTYASGPKGLYRQQTTEVGSFPPNTFGLYDMHGNVWEWCADPWHKDYKDAPSNGNVWKAGGDWAYRILRGGSWISYPGYCRSAARLRHVPDLRNGFLGVRVVCLSI